MHAYDAARFDPPAPLALVAITAQQLAIRDVPMLLDTGADVSLLPRAHVGSLATPDAKQYELESFDGTRTTAPAVTAELHLLGTTFRGQFLLIDGWHGVLGRNILNNLVPAVRRPGAALDRAALTHPQTTMTATATAAAGRERTADPGSPVRPS
jgi:hypothetical protein